MSSSCPHLYLSRCLDCPDVCTRTKQSVDEEDCAECQRRQELNGDAKREEPREGEL